MENHVPGLDPLKLAQEWYDTERLLAANAKQIARLQQEQHDLSTKRIELGRQIARVFVGDAAVDATPPFPAWLLPPPVIPDEEEAKPKKVPYKSREDVKGVASTILTVLDADIDREWKSVDLIDEVLRREEDPKLQRNTVSTALYRLSKSGLVVKVVDGVLKSALSTETSSPEGAATEQGGGAE